MSWEAVEEVLPRAKAIAFDGCHKIYVLMDDEQVRLSESYGYREGSSHLIDIAEDADRSWVLSQLQTWFEDSCGLRFVEAVETVDGDPNRGYIHLIEQFELDEWDNDGEEEDEEE